MILIIDNYDSFTYNLVQLLAALGAEVEVRRNDALTAEEALALSPAGIVISPGPGTPDDAGISRDVIRAAADAGVPLLGVCLGHQCIAEVYGGTVCRSPKAVHGKTDEVSHNGKGIFAGIPSPFTATRYHSLCVEFDSVPDTLEVVAHTPDGVIMGLRHRDLPVFGVQFHPESVLTPEGTKLLANFLDVTGEVPLARGASGTPAIVAAAGGTARASAGTADVVNTAGAIGRVATGASLTEDEAYAVMNQIMDGEATPSQISALITGMRMKGETVDEIVGFARAMRSMPRPCVRQSPATSTRAARAATGCTRSTSRPPPRSSSQARGCRSPSTVTVRSPRLRAVRTCSRRSASTSRSGLRTWRAASTRPASASCSRRRSTPRCATPAPRAARSASAPSSTSSAR